MKSCMKNGKPPFINGWRSRSSDLLPLEPSRQVGEAVGVDCVVKSEMKKFPFIFAVIGCGPTARGPRPKGAGRFCHAASGNVSARTRIL